MNEYYYMYTKLLKEFGKHCSFDDSEPKPLAVIDSHPQLREAYVEQNPRALVSDNIPKLSEHAVNTERVSTANKGIKHVEGGWPKEVDATEHQETSKWRKRLDKDPHYAEVCRTLANETSKYLQQNNTIDMYEEYFTEGGGGNAIASEDLSVRTLMLFKDQVETCKRTCTRICWHPEGPTKLAVAYSIMRFQKLPDPMPTMSFVWDVTNPNVPVAELAAPNGSPAVTLQYNQKNPDIIVGGCYNGLIQLWDVRKGSTPSEASRIENSHYDPVYDVTWLQSKTNSECVSVSTDGRVLWWDTRKLAEPVDQCELTDGNKENPKALGGVALEWALEAGPTKYLVGTEQGIVLSLNKKPKKAVEVNQRFGLDQGAHYGPVYAVKRNPLQSKFFLTVGDWSAKVWMEELKTPIITTQFHRAALMTGAWSPTRSGLFMVARQDGYIDFWDFFYRQNEVAFQHKVGDHALWSMAWQQNGKLVAVGDTDGTVTLVEMCDAFWAATPAEKGHMGMVFERETRREKNLEQAKKAAEGKKGQHEKGGKDAGGSRPTTAAVGEQVESSKKFEADFFTQVGLPVPQQADGPSGSSDGLGATGPADHPGGN